MLTSKTLKLVSLGLSLAGAIIGIAGSMISDKRQSLEMAEQINLAVDQKLIGMSIPETTIDEEL